VVPTGIPRVLKDESLLVGPTICAL
jgi:hypothetical protein